MSENTADTQRTVEETLSGLVDKVIALIERSEAALDEGLTEAALILVQQAEAHISLAQFVLQKSQSAQTQRLLSELVRLAAQEAVASTRLPPPLVHTGGDFQDSI